MCVAPRRHIQMMHFQLYFSMNALTSNCNNRTEEGCFPVAFVGQDDASLDHYGSPYRKRNGSPKCSPSQKLNQRLRHQSRLTPTKNPRILNVSDSNPWWDDPEEHVEPRDPRSSCSHGSPPAPELEGKGPTVTMLKRHNRMHQRQQLNLGICKKRPPLLKVWPPLPDSSPRWGLSGADTKLGRFGTEVEQVSHSRHILSSV